MNYTQDFLQFKNELHSFIFRLLANRQDAEDVVQETYLRVHQHIDSFRGDSPFKTWVFAIAVNLAKNHLNTQRRWRENAQDYGAELHTHSAEHDRILKHVFHATPEKNYEIKEHIAYCLNCMSKTLAPNQQICLLLKEVYAFTVSEIMQITGFSEGVVKHAIADARKHMIRIFDGRCSFVSKKGVCYQCTVLKGVFNPEHNAHVEARKIKMVKQGAHPDKEYLLDLRFDIMKHIDPLNAPNSTVNIFMLEHNERWVEEAQAKKLL